MTRLDYDTLYEIENDWIIWPQFYTLFISIGFFMHTILRILYLTFNTADEFRLGTRGSMINFIRVGL